MNQADAADAVDETAEPSPGVLYVIGTPIGNRGDLSPRAAGILRRLDLLACEDTRITRRLFPADPGALPDTLAYRDDNEQRQVAALIHALEAGKRVGLVSDAGMPGISDPGFRIVRACRAKGINVVPVPGPNAAIAALSASGLPSDRFLFVGFLPARKAARRRFFDEQRAAPHTLVLYESCHRILKALDDLEATVGGERIVCVAREVTKRFETILTGPLARVRPEVEHRAVKGEFVLLIAPEDYRLEPDVAHG
ncbi:MAG: 16S rRNA (cytidine(1402)-2'-O)-methyltransferase [Opitutales bacterium]